MSKPVLVQAAEENCAYIEKLRTELAVKEAEVRRADAAGERWAQQAERDHQLAAEWQQRANELSAEVEAARDKAEADARRTQELEAEVRLRSEQCSDQFCIEALAAAPEHTARKGMDETSHATLEQWWTRESQLAAANARVAELEADLRTERDRVRRLANRNLDAKSALAAERARADAAERDVERHMRTIHKRDRAVEVAESEAAALRVEVRGLLRKVQGAATAVEQVTNSTQELADDWYASELERLGTPSA